MKPCKTCKEFTCGANGSDYVSMRCGSEEGFVRVASDCLPNAAELVWKEQLDAYFGREDDCMCDDANAKTLENAADAIEHLLAENAKLKAERDAAVADMTNIVHDMCGTCICDYCIGCERNGRAGCETDDGDRWEWRGV